ncbi:hypothetical protein HZC33_01260 [Candidatus Wolfebacteria bacterium]|nr:hypothetical protein [Candidatus Wolfebacteria bacterium]
MNKFILTIIAALFIVGVNNVFAVSGGITSGSGLTNPLGAGATIWTLLDGLIGFLIKVGSFILPIMVLYGGYLILSAGDDPKKVESGREVILWAVVGFIIILCSWGVIYIIGDVLGISIPTQ